MKALVIIPAFNEEKCLQNTVNNFISHHKCNNVDYLIVNDGSKDRTKDICIRNDYNFLDLPINIGLSGAVQAGMKYAKQNNYDCALQFDADGQHDARYINTMIDTMSDEKYDIVIGSRFIDLSKIKDKSLRMIGSRMIQHAIKLTTGILVCDPTSGFRAYNRRAIELFANDASLQYEPDSISYLLRCGFRIKEIPVEMNERFAGESYLSGSSAIKYMANVIISILFVQWFRKKEI